MYSYVNGIKNAGDLQFGFQANHSTQDAVFVLSSLIQSCKASNSPYHALFIDISKVCILHSNNTVNWYAQGLRFRVLGRSLPKTAAPRVWGKSAFPYQIHVSCKYSANLFIWKICSIPITVSRHGSYCPTINSVQLVNNQPIFTPT